MVRSSLEIYVDILKLCMTPSGITKIVHKCGLNIEIAYRYVKPLLLIKVLDKIEDRHIINNIKSRGTKPTRLYVTNWTGEYVIQLFNEMNRLLNPDVDIEAEENINGDVLSG